VLRPGGRVVIQVPYFRSIDAFSDPTHKHFFTAQSLDYFVEGSKLATYHYSKALFRKAGFWYGWPHKAHNPLVQVFKKFIHNHTKAYDQSLSILMPSKCVTWELEKI